MATETSSIDELLMTGAGPSTPPTSENKSDYEPQDDAPGNDFDTPEPESNDDFYSTPEERENKSHEPTEEVEEEEQEPETDDYGNTKAAPKTYTEEELNERINKAVRERLSRGNNQSQHPTQQQVNQQAQEFEYNPESSESWEAQLEKFVEKTVSKIGHKQAQQEQRARDEAYQAEFEGRFNQGMSRFSDFREVVSSQPITDPMTYALRGMQDPAAFIYAASKRNPQELQRISQIADPAVQMMEMGRLEQSMRRPTQGTKAPKPISKTREEGGLPTQQKKKEPSIEDLIANSDSKRRQQFNQRRGGR